MRLMPRHQSRKERCAANGSLLPKDYFDLAQMEEPKREQCRRKARIMIYASICKSMDRVVVSYSTSAELSMAQALGLKVDKIELHEGRRMAYLSLDETVADVTKILRSH